MLLQVFAIWDWTVEGDCLCSVELEPSFGTQVNLSVDATLPGLAGGGGLCDGTGCAIITCGRQKPLDAVAFLS